ncbi:MAG: hypothetical protein ACLR78_03230 [Roseburia sp.]
MDAYQYIDEIVSEGKKNCLPAAQAWAEKVEHEPVFYVLASGPNYGVAYSMCCCHFMEMQWRHAVCLHTGEYFHGPFETTDKKLPMILLMSEGRTRALDERCLKFLNTYAENFIIIDFEKLNGGKSIPSVAEFFNPVVMIPIERYYVSQLAEKTGHSMDERRYMWKVEVLMIKVIGIGDNVCDQYYPAKIMYPGGQAMNFSVYAKMLGAKSAYLGVFKKSDRTHYFCS